MVLASYYRNLDSIFKSDTKNESKLEDLETTKAVKHIKKKWVAELQLNIPLISEKMKL